MKDKGLLECDYCGVVPKDTSHPTCSQCGAPYRRGRREQKGEYLGTYYGEPVYSDSNVKWSDYFRAQHGYSPPVVDWRQVYRTLGRR